MSLKVHRQETTSRPWVIIGNPENRRVTLFQRALESMEQKTGQVLSYADLLDDPSLLDSIPQSAIIRIDSPGENFEVEKKLLSRGYESALQQNLLAISDVELKNLKFDRGRILYPRQWYLGFCNFLSELSQFFEQRNDLLLTSSPLEIGELFDKGLCHAHCHASGIPVPPSLPAITSFAHLIDQMKQDNIQRVFIKLANGSSASGVVAFHRRVKSMSAITSVEMTSDHGEFRFYNSLKLRHYSDPSQIALLVNWLISNHVHIQQWLPKAVQDGRNFDARVVVINSQPRHLVIRSSQSPMTNLHLGNRRGNADLLRSQLSSQQWQALEQTCCLAQTCYPNAGHLGLDVMWSPGLRQHSVLEINAFGDLLPNVLHDGLDTYQAQIKHFVNRSTD